MSRTYRKINNRYGLRYSVDEKTVRDKGSYYSIHLKTFWFRISSDRDWRHARDVLSDGDFAYLRIQAGDVGTKFYLNGSIKKEYRQRAEKKLRRANKRELHKFTKCENYEPVVRKNTRSDEYYW